MTSSLRSSAGRLAGGLRPAATEMRRSLVAVTVCVPLLLVGINDILRRTETSGVSWVMTHHVLRSEGLLLAVPFAVAFGFWQGGRERRRRTGELMQSMAAAPLRRTVLAAVPSAAWPMLGYACAAGVTLTLTAALDHYGTQPHLMLYAADIVAIGALGTLGFVLGRVLRWTVAAPALAIASGVVLGVAGDTDGPAQWLSPAYGAYFMWSRPVWWFGPATMMWCGGLAAAALLAYAARRRMTAILACAVALVGAGALVAGGDGLWRTDPAAIASVCDDEEVRLCLTASHASSLPEASAALEAARAKLHGIPTAPSRLVEVPLDQEGMLVFTPERGIIVREFYGPPIERNLDSFAKTVAQDIARAGCAAVPEEESDAVARWLVPSDRPGPSGETKARLAELKTMPKAARDAYLSDYFHSVRNCPHPVG